MLKSQLLHPRITAALASAGHSGTVLISDGNYPHSTRKGASAEVVYLNLAPGQPTVTDVLKTLLTAIPVEAAHVMDYARGGPYALEREPEIWAEFRRAFADSGNDLELKPVERFAFYHQASNHDHCLTIATGEQRIYANLLLTIGVVRN